MGFGCRRGPGWLNLRNLTLQKSCAEPLSAVRPLRRLFLKSARRTLCVVFQEVLHGFFYVTCTNSRLSLLSLSDSCLRSPGVMFGTVLAPFYLQVPPKAGSAFPNPPAPSECCERGLPKSRTDSLSPSWGSLKNGALLASLHVPTSGLAEVAPQKFSVRICRMARTG